MTGFRRLLMVKSFKFPHQLCVQIADKKEGYLLEMKEICIGENVICVIKI